MSQDQFFKAIISITEHLAGQTLDAELETYLHEKFPQDGDAFRLLSGLCREGIDEGWLCNREHGGIRFGRIMNASPETHGFSVDVVQMDEIVGPHHRHPTGEIDMIIPETQGAEFDGCGEGWLVYGPDSAHSPTVTNGRAIVLYLLPEGQIEFTGA